jgi:hypothetical protein
MQMIEPGHDVPWLGGELDHRHVNQFMPVGIDWVYLLLLASCVPVLHGSLQPGHVSGDGVRHFNGDQPGAHLWYPDGTPDIK